MDLQLAAQQQYEESIVESLGKPHLLLKAARTRFGDGDAAEYIAKLEKDIWDMEEAAEDQRSADERHD